MDRLVFWIYRSFRGFLRLFPLTTVYRFGQAAGFIGYYLAPAYRRLVLRNLEIAFGDEKSAEERRQMARAHFTQLLANLFSSVKVSTLNRVGIDEVAEVIGAEIPAEIVAGGRGVILVISHFGNWELFAQLLPQIYRGVPAGTIYQRLGNPWIDAEMRASRSRLGVQLFERQEGFGIALQLLRNCGGVGVLVDQHAGDKGVWCPFFGRLASTSPLAATLARRSGAALVPAAIYTKAPGRWCVQVDPEVPQEGRSVDQLTAEINLALEEQIRRQSADWFWVHNRWKTPKPKFLLATYKRGTATADTASLDEEGGISAGASGLKGLKPFRIVIRSSNWLGDAIMSAPAVRAIKRGRPDAHVTILTPAKLAEVWRQMPEVDEVLEIAAGDNVFKVARKLRAGNFEAAVLFPNSVRVALEAWLAGIPRRVGYPGHRREWLLNQVLREKRSKKAPQKAERPRHQVHHYLALAKFIGADISAEGLKPTGAMRDGLAASRGAGKPRVGLCPGAEYGPAKRWLPERFAEVMRRGSETHGWEWVIFGVAKDAETAAQIEQLAPGVSRNLVGKTSLAELIQELRGCDVLLTNDTGTMHLAAFLGVPTVSVFGSTEPALTGPLGDGHRVIRHHVECSPCFLRECPIDFRCMHAVEADEVLGALENSLSAHRTNGQGAMS